MRIRGVNLEGSGGMTRRHWGRSALAAWLLAEFSALPASAQLPSALLGALLPLQNDGLLVVQLWPILTEKVRLAALMSKCDLHRQELTEIEWDARFQDLIAKDARGFFHEPLFNRFFIQPWVRSVESDWSALSAKEKKRWTDWLGKPEAKSVLQSLRAERVIETIADGKWGVDERTGQWIATAPILAAQALTDMGMKKVFDRAVARTNAALGRQWSRVKPFPAMGREDAKWLAALSEALHESAQKIYDSFDGLATSQWPEREIWLNGELGDIPGQCGFSIRGDEAREFEKAAFSFSSRSYAPSTFEHYCGKRG